MIQNMSNIWYNEWMKHVTEAKIDRFALSITINVLFIHKQGKNKYYLTHWFVPFGFHICNHVWSPSIFTNQSFKIINIL